MKIAESDVIVSPIKCEVISEQTLRGILIYDQSPNNFPSSSFRLLAKAA